jgi:Protein of unknown function (DUF2785)
MPRLREHRAAAARCTRYVLLVLPLLCATTVAQAAGEHPTAYWLTLKQAQFRLTQKQSAVALATEATQMLGSTNPEVRDGIAYEALSDWIYRDQLFTTAQLEVLRTQLEHNAVRGLGAVGDDSLFLRSFSILVLSVLAAEDMQKPFLSQEHYAGLVDLGIQSLTEERDLRGYVPGTGWGHATAHAADLLKFLARNPKLGLAQQQRMVEAVARRLKTAGQVFVWGEDARLAATLAAVARRPDADAENFSRWFDELRAAHRRLWGGAFDPALYVAERAQLNALGQLSLNLDSDPAAPGSPQIRALMSSVSRDLR